MTDFNWWTLAAGFIGALLGAMGAVLAQIVSAHFTAKRETERLGFEKGKHQLEMTAKSTALFFDSKKTAFVAALQEAEELRDIFSEASRELLVSSRGGYPPTSEKDSRRGNPSGAASGQRLHSLMER
ncbi:hypothetical protein NIBR502772_11370 [Pseudarthrobacter sp. NIBRBAC000502772]|uniref:hypothetical protein n=1 Tax=Pseudarthrobacter sp. NIBRBAC000502772 TaxID=2590775 RepID=UPI0011313929|nr:hypothetical protein [Pseudarthrobacter sp. NIBRBAC000502772]QDG66725.1 hypothetical protein NIBR502772_11370 [Pseudarthrobacter sp. NIBRBAC000502772]